MKAMSSALTPPGGTGVMGIRLGVVPSGEDEAD
jgi:hypothetical protein